MMRKGKKGGLWTEEDAKNGVPFDYDAELKDPDFVRNQQLLMENTQLENRNRNLAAAPVPARAAAPVVAAPANIYLHNLRSPFASSHYDTYAAMRSQDEIRRLELENAKLSNDVLKKQLRGRSRSPKPKPKPRSKSKPKPRTKSRPKAKK